MLSTTVISRAPVTGAQLLNHIVAGGTFTAAPTVVGDGFKIRNQAGNSFDALEFTFSFDATAAADTEGQVRPWFWVPDHDPAAAGGMWLAGKIQEGLFISTATSDIQAPVRRINHVPVAATRLYLQVVVINGTAPANLYMVAYGIVGFLADVSLQDVQVDVEISGGTLGAVKLEDGASANRALIRDADVAANLADHVLVTQTQDQAGGIQPAGDDADAAINMRLLGLMGTMSGPGIYVSPVQFTAVYQAPGSLDCAGHPAVTDVSQFVMVVQISNVGIMTVHYPHVSTGAFSWDAANNRLSVAGAAFAATDIFGVVLRGADRGLNAPSNFWMTGEVLPYPLRSDDSGVAQISVLQAFSNSWADVGSEINTFGYSGVTFYLTLDVGDDSDLRFRALGKHTSAGAEEYPFPIRVVGASSVAVEALFYEFTSDLDQLILLRVETNGEVPYLQPQIVRGVDGLGVDAELDACYYIRGAFGGAA